MEKKHWRDVVGVAGMSMWESGWGQQSADEVLGGRVGPVNQALPCVLWDITERFYMKL